jgi:hypothetical protein
MGLDLAHVFVKKLFVKALANQIELTGRACRHTYRVYGKAWQIKPIEVPGGYIASRAKHVLCLRKAVKSNSLPVGT